MHSVQELSIRTPDVQEKKRVHQKEGWHPDRQTWIENQEDDVNIGASLDSVSISAGIGHWCIQRTLIYSFSVDFHWIKMNFFGHFNTLFVTHLLENWEGNPTNSSDATELHFLIVWQYLKIIYKQTTFSQQVLYHLIVLRSQINLVVQRVHIIQAAKTQIFNASLFVVRCKLKVLLL